MNVTSSTDLITAVTTTDGRRTIPALYAMQVIINLIGIFTNTFTLAALVCIGRQFSPCIRLLLVHQSWIDSWVCLQGFILQVQPYKWRTGNVGFDTFVCHIWHSQTVFWGSVDISIFGLVMIACERYIATCHPLKHLSITPKSFMIAIICVNVFSMVILMMPSYFQSSMKDGICTTDFYFSGPAFDRLMSGYPIIIFIVTYFLPCVLFIFFYGSILRLLRKRKQQKELGESQIVSKANTEILKTAIVVTT